MKHVLMGITLMLLLITNQVVAPATSNSLISAEEKYENFSVFKNKKEILKEVAFISNNNFKLISKLDSSFILNDYETQQALVELSNKLNVRPAWFLATFYHESRISTTAKNPYTNATGLIQFMPKTAEYLGTTTTQLSKMSFIEQFYYIEKYISYYKNISSYEDLYLAVFFPVALNKSDYYIIGKSPPNNKSYKNMNFREKTYVLNKAMDVNKDGLITVKDFKKYATNFT